MKLQDNNIESEVNGLEKHFSLQVTDLAKMIDREYKEFLSAMECI